MNKMRISYDFVRFELINLGVRGLGSQICVSMWSGFYWLESLDCSNCRF